MTHVSIVPNDLTACFETTHPLRFLRLPHPRTGVPSLFLPYSKNSSTSSTEPSNVVLEVQAVAPHSCRSWFLDEGQIIADGKLLAMTPIDPMFLLLPILQAAQPEDGSVGNFRQCDDIFEEAAARLSIATSDPKIAPVKSSDIMTLAGLECVTAALRRMCDVKDLTEEISVYRFSRVNLLQTLRAKISRLSEPEIFDSFPSLYRGLARNGLLDESKEILRQAGRARASCEILSQYLPPDVTNDLLASYDFAALHAHTQTLMDEDNANDSQPPKNSTNLAREKENDKKRKAASQVSKGVSKLMKVNTSGMAKISSFFKKPMK